MERRLDVHFGRMMRPDPRKGSFPTFQTARYQIFALALCTLLSRNVLAFEYSLQPEQIAEAHSFGQTSNHEDLRNFLEQYERNFKYPADNPAAYLQSAEFQTPYEQIVLRSKQAGAQYDKFRAAEDYQANSRLVNVRVVVALRINYGGAVPNADSYEVAVWQAKRITPKKVSNTVLCDPYSQIAYPYSVNRDCSAYAREIILQFDAGQFSPAPATVRVMLPNEQTLETKYNLDALK